ncbi:PUA-like domain-containing protein [Desarmillaria ectypa]|nr:PUA-like domain-containing protein [Desarmillaria ectypa]
MFTCNACNDLLTLPTTLRCGHSVCATHAPPTCPDPDCTPDPDATAHHDVTLKKLIEILHEQADDDDDDGILPTSPDNDQDDDDSDLLAHLKTESARQKATSPSSPLLRPSHEFPSGMTCRQKRLLTDLTCEICYMLLYEPVTTPCQHTFCTKCLHRSLDHSSACPLCRAALPPFSFFQSHPPNALILRVITTFFEVEYNARAAAILKAERDARLDTPIFVCQLSFPGMPTFLHFFEPRYRLMLRRCLGSPHRSFGMIMPPRPGAQLDYGTMLEIKSVQTLPDGRSMVETWGSWRFRILERGSLDGYMVARIERVEDYADEINVDINSTSAPSEPGTSSSHGDSEPILPSLSESPTASSPTPLLISHCLSFLTHLHNHSTPWVVQRLSTSYGPPPSLSTALARPGLFSFYVAIVLPIDESEKAKLLPIRSVRMRLRLCVWWIEGLRREWWFDRGCVIL